MSVSDHGKLSWSLSFRRGRARRQEAPIRRKGRVIRSHGRGRRRAQHAHNDRVRRKFAHVVNLNMLVRERHTRLPEQAFDRPRMTSGNAQPTARRTLTQGRQSRVPMRRHFTEIRDTLKT